MLTKEETKLIDSLKAENENLLNVKNNNELEKVCDKMQSIMDDVKLFTEQPFKLEFPQNINEIEDANSVAMKLYSTCLLYIDTITQNK